jgi:nucleotide-binding universal stress UspA family protein
VLDYGFSTADFSRQDVIATLCKVGKKILGKAEAAVRERGLTPECMLFESEGSSAGNVILDQARQWPADLIVMGTHPRGDLIGIGGDTAEVLSESSVPVLMVRGPSIATAAKGHHALDYASPF